MRGALALGRSFVIFAAVILPFSALPGASFAEDLSSSTVGLSVPGNRAWIDTGLSVGIGDEVDISASGLIACGSCPQPASPEGEKVRASAGASRPFLASGLDQRALVGRIGKSPPFGIGAHSRFVSGRAGPVVLAINDDDFSDNRGQWSVTVRITRASQRLIPLSPFRLGASDLADLDLKSLIPALGDFSSARAAGLAADNSATAIVLWRASASADVTFTADNGATLAPYRADFLTLAPQAGSSSLTVPASDLIRAGGARYAPVLIQAPAPGATRSFSKPVTVTAAEAGGPSGDALLDLVPPPVLFIHGLWGDHRSLNSTHAALKDGPPWRANPDLLLKIEYPIDLRFDSNVISQRVFSGLSALLAREDSKRFVGGRVDVVAHSMGGLVVRNFSSLSAYRSLADRGLGAFHALTTLDTPQLGSALARFLIVHRDAHAQAPFDSEANLTWLAVCGSRSRTVAQCFDDNDMPILSPQGTVRGGAVWSLVPGNAPLGNAPILPSIADLVWGNILSVVRPSDDSPLRKVIRNLIGAIFRHPETAPTPTTILGGPNDVIVSRESQAEDSTGRNRIPFLGLDHTVLKILGAPVNNSVINSGLVNERVACWLKKEGDSSCVPSDPIVASPASVARASTRPAQAASGLLHVPRRAEIGVPLHVAATASAVREITVAQRNGARSRTGPDTVRNLRVRGSTVQFDIMPSLLGTVRFDVALTFADGSVKTERFTREVGLRDDLLRELHADESREAFLSMRIGGPLTLDPSGVFANIEDVVSLKGQVEYTLVSAGTPPTVSIEDGRIVPLRPGAARVEARLGSHTDVLKVTVEP